MYSSHQTLSSMSSLDSATSTTNDHSLDTASPIAAVDQQTATATTSASGSVERLMCGGGKQPAPVMVTRPKIEQRPPPLAVILCPHCRRSVVSAAIRVSECDYCRQPMSVGGGAKAAYGRHIRIAVELSIVAAVLITLSTVLLVAGVRPYVAVLVLWLLTAVLVATLSIFIYRNLTAAWRMTNVLECVYAPMPKTKAPADTSPSLIVDAIRL